jgi:hypothetical protein
MALKVMAFFMLNGGSDFYMQGTNALERISHQYHMHEIYAAAVPIYNRLKDNPPNDPRLCSCVNDIYGNGIFANLIGSAEILKSFAEKPSEQDCSPQSEKELSKTEPTHLFYKNNMKIKPSQTAPKSSIYENDLKTEPSKTDPKLFVYNYDLKKEEVKGKSSFSIIGNI